MSEPTYLVRVELTLQIFGADDAEDAYWTAVAAVDRWSDNRETFSDDTASIVVASEISPTEVLPS